MTATIEKRRGELRADASGRPRRLIGFAARYGAVADIGAFRERISPGAFAGSIEEGGSDILALLDHDPGKVLGRTRSNTLRLDNRSDGLAFEINVPDTTAGRDALVLAIRGDIGGASIGFIVEDEARERDSAGDVRVIRRARLLEISIVSSWPAYAGTEVEARGRVASPERTPRLDALQRYLATVRTP